jgi:hypothetical protein
MANVKITSYIDAITKETRTTAHDDVTAALEIVEAEIEHMRMDSERDIRQLNHRLEALEKIRQLEHRIDAVEKIRQIEHRLEAFEKGGGGPH